MNQTHRNIQFKSAKTVNPIYAHPPLHGRPEGAMLVTTMEITPEHLPPARREATRERVYEYRCTVRQVHPLVGLLMAVVGLGLMVLMLVFFFWIGLVMLGLAALVFVVRTVWSLFSPPPKI